MRSRNFFIRRWRRIAILGLVFLIFSAVSVEVTSRPKFCNSCHIMEPYYDSWHRGTHKDVPCVSCHIAPGAASYIHAKLNGLGQVVDDLLNRTSTKPSAMVADSSCTRSGCHNIGELGDTESGQREGRTFHFNHEKHLNHTYLGIPVNCATCHSYVKGDQHFEVNTNACFSCHLMGSYAAEHTTAADFAQGRNGMALPANHAFPPDSQLAASDPHAAVTTRPFVAATSSCDVCHSPPTKPFEHNGVMVDHGKYLSFGAACNSCHMGITAAPSPVDDSRCLNCHGFGMERILPMEDMHRVHSEGKHKVECFNCHGLIQHGSVAESQMLDQFDCRSCHSGQHGVQRSMYLKPPEDHATDTGRLAVSPMFLTHVPCTGCHVGLDPIRAKPGSGALVARATPDACDSCHRPGLGAMQVPLWQKNTRALHVEVAALLADAKTRNAGNDANAISLFREAEQLLDIVRLDGSWGVHNPRYTQELLDRARSKIIQASAQPPTVVPSP